MSANCSLVLSFYLGFDYEQVEKVGLLVIKLVIRLVTEAFSQLGLLSIEMILEPKIGKAI